MYANLGWIHIISALSGSNVAQNEDAAYHYFSRAVYLSPQNGRANIGYGLSAAMRSKEQLAQDLWQRYPEDPSQMYALAQAMRGQQRDRLSLLLLRTIDKEERNVGKLSWYLSGNICQSRFASLPELDLGSAAYCKDFFAKNDSNLLLNHSFEESEQLGWFGFHYFTPTQNGQLLLASEYGIPPPSLAIQGFHQDEKYAIYQSVSLQPGTRVKFSGWFKSAIPADTRVRLLYIEWQQLGKTEGNHGELLEISQEWFYAERIFQAPNSSTGIFHFYPALLDGKGKVWIDNPSVELVATE